MDCLESNMSVLRSCLNTLVLPGKDAQFKMAPSLRKKEVNEFSQSKDAIKSSILIVIYPDSNVLKTVLILRPQYDGVHSGQIAFPGGKAEQDDANLIETAKREAFEEIGIKKDVEILGHLTELFIPPSNYIVLPVVGFLNQKPTFKIDNKEVDHVIEVPIEDFFNGNIKKKSSVFNVSDNRTVNAPYYKVNNYKVWGATAMIISEFLEVLKETKMFTN